MTAAAFLNRILCRDSVKIICFEGSPFIEFAIWGSLLLAIGIYLYLQWIEGPYYKKPTRIDGKVVIVTGCNTGIGKETALELAKRGGRIYMACRNFERCEKARGEIIQLSGNTNVFNCSLNLQSLQSVREFVQHFQQQEDRLDILINNAGIMAPPKTLTVDGFESQLGVNYLGHFLLTNLLLDRLTASAPSRVVVVSSIAYMIGSIDKEDFNWEKSYNPYKAYGRSKLANILFTRKLAQKLKDRNVTVNCLHPGSVQSELLRNNLLIKVLKNMVSKLLRSARGGAQTAVYLALDPEIENSTGGYYDRMQLGSLMKKATDDDMADWLWHQSEVMTQLKKDK